ncbi:uncharacterized protein F4817DRAFT_84832 [Daldinia loculata]|uniref:uncharacterized protein n=1 Tax=Daldinia loculata TaxID=103429 RepID=UPI0020C4E846|nr:uncharacterized protein F4817DRAFT_84832 [Daldinia loculata]KAI1651900.1 hypothetical protein F4817DRAFT_84832 [Daldinia loculata]
MRTFNQRSSLLSDDRPRRKPDDILFDHQVYQHRQGTRYRWGEQQSKIFQDYVQEFPNDYARNIDILLGRLDLHGYGGIETKQGLNFEGKILIPKVLRKLINVITDPEKSNHGGNQRTPHNQNSDSSTQANHRYPPWPISNSSKENTELRRSYYNAVKVDNNEHPGTTVPQPLLFDTQPPGWSGRLPSGMYGSQDLHRNNELESLVRSLKEKVNNIENIISVKAEDIADA